MAIFSRFRLTLAAADIEAQRQPTKKPALFDACRAESGLNRDSRCASRATGSEATGLSDSNAIPQTTSASSGTSSYLSATAKWRWLLGKTTLPVLRPSSTINPRFHDDVESLGTGSVGPGFLHTCHLSPALIEIPSPLSKSRH